MKKKRGEIWCCEIEEQRRLVVIVANDNIVVDVNKINETILSHERRRKTDVEIEQWLEAGLDTPSIIHCSKINTVHYSSLLFKIGALTEKDFNNVRSTLLEYLT